MSKTTTIVFSGDDAAYLDWLAGNGEGFVVNGRKRRFDPKYLVLHRATCHSISGEREPGAYTERDFIKICSVSRESLIAYLSRKTGRAAGISKECGRCSR
jgi:hypothetical protein